MKLKVKYILQVNKYFFLFFVIQPGARPGPPGAAPPELLQGHVHQDRDQAEESRR